MMRLLVGAACVAVIAFVGFYFGNMVWQDYQAKEAARASSIARADRIACLGHVERQLQGVVNADLKYLAEDCVTRGVVGLEDINYLKSRLGR